MKYSSTDRLQDFEFHDAELSLVCWEDHCLIVSARYLNIHRDAAPDNTGTDMEISDARITFRGIQIHEFEPGRNRKTDKNGQSHTDDPFLIHTDAAARKMFENELRRSITVMKITQENGVYELGALGLDSHFSARFGFSSVKIEWNAYRQKAWYASHKRYKKTLTLATENGDIIVNAHIFSLLEDAYSPHGDKAEAPSVSVSIQYGEKTLRGYGRLWEDAFAALQKELPDTVKIKCCLTCRHGNMCPVGNTPGELFCTKDATVTQKSDLFFYTEDAAEREKRSRSCTDLCEDYREQSETCYI